MQRAQSEAARVEGEGAAGPRLRVCRFQGASLGLRRGRLAGACGQQHAEESAAGLTAACLLPQDCKCFVAVGVGLRRV